MSSRIEVPAALRQARAAKRTSRRGPPTDLAQEMRWNTLLGQQDLLREEIKRGKECLEHTQVEMAKSRAQLEEWPTYERRCGGKCLPCLTESVAVNRRIERFLTGWLKRRESQLSAVDEAIRLFSREHHSGHQPP